VRIITSLWKSRSLNVTLFGLFSHYFVSTLSW
jgi:hypothetical protein